MLHGPASSIHFHLLIEECHDLIIYSHKWTNFLEKQVFFYLEWYHYCYWGLFKGKGSIGNRLLYDNIRFSWREMWAEIFRRQKGSTYISSVTRFWISLIPHCSVLKACLFSHCLVSIATQLCNNICVWTVDLWTHILAFSQAISH